MFFVKLRKGLGIKKNGSGALEGDTMVFEISSRFDGVPLKLIPERVGHLGIIPRNRVLAKGWERNLTFNTIIGRLLNGRTRFLPSLVIIHSQISGACRVTEQVGCMRLLQLRFSDRQQASYVRPSATSRN